MLITTIIVITLIIVISFIVMLKIRSDQHQINITVLKRILGDLISALRQRVTEPSDLAGAILTRLDTVYLLDASSNVINDFDKTNLAIEAIFKLMEETDDESYCDLLDKISSILIYTVDMAILNDED